MTKTTAKMMDGKKYLTIINNSHFAIGKVVTEAFQVHTGLKKLMPVGFDGDQLMIEDRTSGVHYAVKYKNVGGQYVIESYDRLNITNGNKAEAFNALCLTLVESITGAKSDRNKINEAFNKIASYRYSKTSIPAHGIVRTRDGVSHKITVAEDITKRQNSVLAENIGKVYRSNAKLLNEDITSPVSNVKFCFYRDRARFLRTIAEEASKDEGFQQVVAHIAKKVDSHDLTEAVSVAKEFLKTFQEFSNLDRSRLGKVIEESLAASGVFNSRLANDVASLMWKTNIHVNGRVIAEEWRKAGKASGNSTLIENVSILEESTTPEAHYDMFLKAIFCESTGGPRQVQADAYGTALKSLLNVPQIRNEPSMTNRITDLIERLSVEGDQYAILEAEEVLAHANTEAQNASTNLDNFDETSNALDLPDLGVMDDAGADAGAEAGKTGGVTFNININGEKAEIEPPVTPPAPPAPPETANAIGDMPPPPAAGAGAPAGGGGDESQMTFESYIQYANLLNEHVGAAPAFFGHDYGVNPLTFEETSRVTDKLKNMLAESPNTEASLNSLATKALANSGFIIQKNRLEEAANAIVGYFVTSCADMLQEAQYKFPIIKRRGLGKSSNHDEGPVTKKGDGGTPAKKKDDEPVSESYVYTHEDSGTALMIESTDTGYVVGSMTGTAREPVPADVVDSMLYVVKAKKTGDAKLFEDWVSQGIDQFLLDEDATVITVDEDGTVSVDQTDEMGQMINLAEIKPVVDDQMGGDMMGGEMGGMMDNASAADEFAGGGDDFVEDDLDTEETTDEVPEAPEEPSDTPPEASEAGNKPEGEGSPFGGKKAKPFGKDE